MEDQNGNILNIICEECEEQEVTDMEHCPLCEDCFSELYGSALRYDELNFDE